MVLLLLFVWAHDAGADPLSLGSFELKTPLERELFEDGRRQENARVKAETELAGCLDRLSVARTSTVPPPSPTIEAPAPEPALGRLEWGLIGGGIGALVGILVGVALAK